MARTSPDVPGTWEHSDPGIPVFQGEQQAVLIPGLVHRRYAMNGATILISREKPSDSARPLWHLSISRPNRHPSWDDIKAARYRLLPADVDCAVFLPPPDEYVNAPAQDHVFHVWEVE